MTEAEPWQEVTVNGPRIRPAFNRQVVMTAEEAGEYCAVLRPKIAVPIHYAFTARHR